MNIRNFITDDIPYASKIAHRVWGDLYTNETKELQNLIYEFTVLYYDLNRNYSFSILDKEQSESHPEHSEGSLKNKLNGLVLAATKYEKNNSSELFLEKLKSLDAKEQKIGKDLLEYLNTCGNAVKAQMNDDDIMLGLFISQERGCGKALLAKLAETCKEKNIKNIYLWTDTTCDHDYYEKNNFTLVNEVETLVNGQNIRTIIYKKQI